MARMVMRPVPVMFAATAAVTGVSGAAGAVYGSVKRYRAEGQMRDLWAAYSDRHNAHLAEHEKTNEQLRVFGRKHEQVHDSVVLRMRDILVRNNMQVRVGELLVLDGSSSPPPCRSWRSRSSTSTLRAGPRASSSQPKLAVPYGVSCRTG